MILWKNDKRFPDYKLIKRTFPDGVVEYRTVPCGRSFCEDGVIVVAQLDTVRYLSKNVKSYEDDYDVFIVLKNKDDLAIVETLTASYVYDSDGRRTPYNKSYMEEVL